MKLLQEAEDATHDKKLIKSQVEKRRRERMNRSLERLRTMMLQEQHQTQRRVEKAEILEHTVLFLQNTAKDGTRAGGRGQKHSFRDGFSSCLQRAACFLGPEGKGLWLRSALDASFVARLAHADPDPPGVRRPPASPPHTKASFLRMLRQRSKHKLHPQACGVNRFAHLSPLPVQQSFPRVPQQPQKQSRLDIGAESGATKRNSPQSFPVSQTLWRPWP
ncbi:transcription factor HES-2-like [Embiotoca jacksoni]|uniref:transcription factor HES-2-like n=1 Tax=Embiotoca jacksoni TaxID=100190 RepID=UPI0037046A3A